LVTLCVLFAFTLSVVDASDVFTRDRDAAPDDAVIPSIGAPHSPDALLHIVTIGQSCEPLCLAWSTHPSRPPPLA
jgi:hypothetical protein